MDEDFEIEIEQEIKSAQNPRRVRGKDRRPRARRGRGANAARRGGHNGRPGGRSGAHIAHDHAAPRAAAARPPLPPIPQVIRSGDLPSPSDVATHGPIMRTVPRHLRRLFQQAALPILNAYLRASLDKDTERMASACVQFLTLPAIALPLPGGKFAGSKLLKERLKVICRQIRDYAESPAHLRPSGDAAIAADQKRSSDWKLSNVKRSTALVRSGYLGKAAQALTQQGMHDSNDEKVIEELKQLHPLCPDPIPDLPADATDLIIDGSSSKGRKTLRKLIRKLDNGSSGGPSGFTGAHLGVLAQSDDCLRGIAQLLQDINNGTTGSIIRSYITAATLYPLTKPNNGIRPIAVTEIIKRAADGYLNTIVGPIARQLCEPIQFGIGTPGGCEHVILATQALLDTPDHGQTAFLCDVTNAFNTQNRSRILGAIYAEPSLAPMWHNTAYTYGSSSILRLPNGTEILSSNGVKQGECLSSLGYAVSKKSGYQKAASCHAETTRVFAVLDDATVVGPSEHVIDSVKVLHSETQADGQQFNWEKCKFLAHPDNVLPESVTAFLERHGVPIVRDATLLLGAPVGWDRKKMSQMALEIHGESALLFEQLQHPALPPQEAMLILRSCAIPIPVYLSRVLPPAVMLPAAHAFDEQVIITASRILKLPPILEPAQKDQMTLKLINSGFGLPSVVTLSPIAYTCALASAATLLCDAELNIIPNGTPRAGSAFAQDLASALAATRAAVGDDGSALLPPVDVTHSVPEGHVLRWYAATGAEAAADKLQHALSGIADQRRFTNLLAASNRSDRARLHSCSGKSAAAWLLAIPLDRTVQLNPRAYRIASRIRLGLQAHDDHTNECTCGSPNAALDKHHGLSCISVRRTFINMRHDMMKATVHTWCKRMGCSAIMEPQNLVAGQERADNLIATPMGDLFLCDCSIVQPACPSHIEKSQVRLGAAEHAAAAKYEQYTRHAEECGARFVPLIAEVYGALHGETLSFIKRMSWLAEGDDGSPWSRIEAKIGMTSAIAIAIQRGNVLAIDRVHLKNRTAGLVTSRERAHQPALPAAVPRAQPAADPEDHFGADADDVVPLPEGIVRDPAQAHVILPRGLHVAAEDDVIIVDGPAVDQALPDDAQAREHAREVEIVH
jgi:hypothetical protein